MVDAGKRQGGAKGDGILSRLSVLFGTLNDPGRERRRQLKECARRVQRARPRLYNRRSSTADPAMGAVFHDFYRALGPARILLRGASVSNVLRSICVERAMSDRQRQLLASLSEEALAARAQAMEPRELVADTRDRLKTFAADFDRRTVDKARRAHRAVLVLVDLVTFDYWTVLRRFDPRYPEADFTYAPRFLPLDGEYLREPLKDFLEVLAPVEPDLDWTAALVMLKEFRGMEFVSAEAWGRLLRTSSDLKRSAVLLAVVRLLDGDPSYAPAGRVAQPKLVEPYLATVKAQVEASVRRAVEARRQKAMESLAREVFGEQELPRLAGYATATSERLEKKGLPAFAHVAALGYVKAYLIEVHKSRMKKLVDALLIRGAWLDTAMSRSVSDVYQDLLSLLAPVLAFDKSIGENQELGVKLRAAVSRADRGRPQTLAAGAQLVASIDATARGHVTRVGQGCVAFAQLLRSLVEDSGRSKPLLLSNWQDLRSGAGRGDDVCQELVDCFRVLQSFVQLLKLSTSRVADGSSGIGPAQPPETAASEVTAGSQGTAGPEPTPGSQETKGSEGTKGSQLSGKSGGSGAGGAPAGGRTAPPDTRPAGRPASPGRA